LYPLFFAKPNRPDKTSKKNTNLVTVVTSLPHNLPAGPAGFWNLRVTHSGVVLFQMVVIRDHNDLGASRKVPGTRGAQSPAPPWLVVFVVLHHEHRFV
jgi:hypothetical protein